LEALKTKTSAVSVEASLAVVRQLASAPSAFKDPSAMMAALQKLADDARTTGHAKTAEYEAILRQTRPLMFSNQLGDIVHLLGSKEESQVANTIAKMKKALPRPSAPYSYSRSYRGRGGSADRALQTAVEQRMQL